MGSIKDFLIDASNEETQEVKLKRFPSPFVIKSITEEENDALKRQYTVKVRAKNGAKVPDMDTNKYMIALILSCIVEPDLKNADLQAFYNTTGSAGDTLKKMLKPGEYTTLFQAIQDINGFDSDEMDDLVDEAKKD